MVRSTPGTRKKVLGVLFVLFALGGCSLNPARKHFVLAEKLWTEKNYDAAVVEFEKAVQVDPTGQLGVQARFRAASTQYLFLSRYSEALRNFEEVARLSQDPKTATEAQKNIAEILYSKLESYRAAARQFALLAAQAGNEAEKSEYLFLEAKSLFFLGSYEEARVKFEKIAEAYPQTEKGERAALEVGICLFTAGEKGQKTIETAGSKRPPHFCEATEAAFRRFLSKYPKSRWAPEALFGVANCLEETEKTDEALELYRQLLLSYPSPKVVKIKLARIQERKKKKGH